MARGLLIAPHAPSMQGVVKESVKVNSVPDTKVRTAPGDYGDARIITDEEREHFLNAVWRVTPKPLDSLREEIWPKYRVAVEDLVGYIKSDELEEAFLQGLRVVALKDEIESRGFTAPAFRLPELLHSAAKSLIEWSKHFNLVGLIREDFRCPPDDPRFVSWSHAWHLSLWPLVVAEQTLWMWHSSPDRERLLREPPRWRRTKRLGGLTHGLELLPPIELTEQSDEMFPGAELLNTLKASPGKVVKATTLPGKLERVDWPMRGWNIETEPEQRFRERFNEAAKRWLDRYILERRVAGEQKKLTHVTEKRRPEHYEWLALYQIARQSQQGIADQYKESRDAVKSALERTAQLIGLKLRPGARGRPRG